jgi:large subunit ribosomal protein L17
LVNHERIITTDAKAKELRRVAERLITKAKRLGEAAHTSADKLSAGDKSKRLHVARLLGAYLPRWAVERGGKKRDLIEKVLVDLSQRMASRNGGYTRIVKLGPRRGDGASMSLIELVDAPPVQPVEAEQAAGEQGSDE